MTEYERLLTAIEWKNVRNQIVQRDSKRCLNCQNMNVIIETRPYVVKRKSTGEFWYSVTGDQLHFRRVETPVRAKIDMDVMAYFKGTFLLSNEFNYLGYISIAGINSISYYVSALVQVDRAIANEGITYSEFSNPLRTKDFLSSATFLYTEGLHVHHTYYKDGLMPWEYPTNDLLTLCWRCHEMLHKNVKVPHLDKFGNEKARLTPCPRCYGAGWFPEFRHVEGGICFQCRGKRYLELPNM